MTKRSKRILSYILAIWLMGNLSYDDKPKPHYEIVNNGIYFANYSLGRIFIGSKEDIGNLDIVGENDVLIIDARDEEDPDMKVIDSYKVIESVYREEVILVMQEYERLNPSNWYRTNKTMSEEWTDHNNAYYFGYETNRTKDVDFNNRDEKRKRLVLIKDIAEK